MKIALIGLSDEGARVVSCLAKAFPDADIFLHEKVSKIFKAQRFGSVAALTRAFFGKYDNLLYVAPCGVVVRALAPNIQNKHTDPAVVVVDVGERFAISLLSGHEGGANDLAIRVSNILGAEPVITTTTEALKNVIVGIGCRRGTESEAIIHAVKEVLRQASIELAQVRMLASADVKADEEGLLRAAFKLGIPLRFIRSEEIRECFRQFERSDFVEEKVKLPAVAEPSALLAGRRTRLILPKTICNGVTVAVARESFTWSESAQEDL
jgi:cobalt-precorrin 5A hydrolase